MPMRVAKILLLAPPWWFSTMLPAMKLALREKLRTRVVVVTPEEPGALDAAIAAEQVRLYKDPCCEFLK